MFMSSRAWIHADPVLWIVTSISNFSLRGEGGDMYFSVLDCRFCVYVFNLKSLRKEGCKEWLVQGSNGNLRYFSV
jgi:hypothetical protein